MSYVLRTTVPPEGLAPVVHRAIRDVDANLPIVQVRTLQDMLDHAAAYMAFTMILLAIAASVALLLGAIGIYGVMSYIVSQRRTEIGLRLALGAEPRGVALLHEVNARDPNVFAATTLALLVVALIACWLPARRASRENPLDALRAD
jgi:putative ABC transport system permease protein